jgi:hypothetical protein
MSEPLLTTYLEHFAVLICNGLEEQFAGSEFEVRVIGPCRFAVVCNKVRATGSPRILSDMQMYAFGFYAVLRAHCSGEGK